jgi:hypothetical protein
MGLLTCCVLGVCWCYLVSDLLFGELMHALDLYQEDELNADAILTVLRRDRSRSSVQLGC